MEMGTYRNVGPELARLPAVRTVGRDLTSLPPLVARFRQNHSDAAGNVIENVAPRSGLLTATIFPPWRSMMERQIDRPIPSPSGLLVTNGSKIDSSLSGAIPLPLS